MSEYLNDIIKGSTKTYKYSFTNSTGAALDITDYKIWFMLKSSIADDDDDAIVSKTAVITDGDGGLAETTLTAAETALLDTGSYYAGFKYKKPDGTVIPFNPTNNNKINVIAHAIQKTS